MEILIVGVKWPPETFIQRKIEGLLSSGSFVTAVTRDGNTSRKSKVSRLRVLSLPRYNDPIFLRICSIVYNLLCLIILEKNASKFLRYFWVLSKSESIKAQFMFLHTSIILARHKPSIVHFEWNSAAIDYWYMKKIWKESTFIISCRGGQVNIRPHIRGNELFTTNLVKTLSEAEAVHCVSDAIRGEVARLGALPEKISIIRPAVDPFYFMPGVKSRESSTILRITTTGSLIWRKGYEYALLATKHLLEQNISVSLDIIGDGPERSRILYTINDLGIEGAVQLFGRLSPEEVRNRLQQSDVFLLSSVSEGIQTQF